MLRACCILLLWMSSTGLACGGAPTRPETSAESPPAPEASAPEASAPEASTPAASPGASSASAESGPRQAPSAAASEPDRQPSIGALGRLAPPTSATPAGKSYRANFRIDAASGGLDRWRSRSALRKVESQLEQCAEKVAFDKPWTIGLAFEVGVSGVAEVSVTRAKEPTTACIAAVVRQMRFPRADRPTRIDAALMIQIPAAPQGAEGKDGTHIGGVASDGTGSGKSFLGGIGIGGTGTGQGTIGLGRYGTIGHGSGSGSGYGSRKSSRSNPQVRIGGARARTRGTLDKNIIRRYIRRSLSRVRFCYEKELLRKPTLKGTVTVRFIIQADGKVRSASGKGVNKAVSGCVERVIRRIVFPKPKGGGLVHVTYPFSFQPASPSP